MTATRVPGGVILFDGVHGRPLVLDPVADCLRMTTDDRPEPTRFPDYGEAIEAITASVAYYRAAGLEDDPSRYVFADPRRRKPTPPAEAGARRRRARDPEDDPERQRAPDPGQETQGAPLFAEPPSGPPEGPIVSPGAVAPLPEGL